MIDAVGNFIVNSGQRLSESGKIKAKNKVPRKTAGLLPENGGRKLHFLDNPLPYCHGAMIVKIAEILDSIENTDCKEKDVNRSNTHTN